MGKRRTEGRGGQGRERKREGWSGEVEEGRGGEGEEWKKWWKKIKSVWKWIIE